MIFEAHQRGGFQCVETLVFVSKHAEGMSLRCDVICALAYCGRHESSHIVKAHTDSARFDKKIICGNLCEFVADYLEHGLHGLYGYVGLLNLCEGCVRWGWCDGGGAIALF